QKFTDRNTCLAAYNAGEGNVKKWLGDKNYSNDGITLDVIPITETADYVKKVNKSLTKYKNLYFNILDKR
ncbi:MAG: dephospho-CoA kinase, partial [Clostridia bacterium]|nr:dephospho-CoA kinase [Clostridia bacterium]